MTKKIDPCPNCKNDRNFTHIVNSDRTEGACPCGTKWEIKNKDNWEEEILKVFQSHKIIGVLCENSDGTISQIGEIPFRKVIGEILNTERDRHKEELKEKEAETVKKMKGILFECTRKDYEPLVYLKD